jgi:hypothetical protein
MHLTVKSYVFSEFTRKCDRIKTMGDRTPKIFEEVLQHLEGNHGKQLVQYTCALICTSRNGLLESELRGLVNVSDFPGLGFCVVCLPSLNPLVTKENLHSSISNFMLP